MARRHAGFSLIELMIVVILVMAISGVILQVINMAGSRSVTEQAKTDVFQEAREFMDQMSRDLLRVYQWDRGHSAVEHHDQRWKYYRRRRHRPGHSDAAIGDYRSSNS